MYIFRKLGLTTILLFLLLIGQSCEKKVQNESKDSQILTEEVQEREEQGFNAELARKYGADDYGMKKYVLAFLKRGPNQDLDSVKKMELQSAHLANITRMAEEGKLVLAGPFFGNDELRGIYIFDVESLQEAEDLTNSDPAIQAGSLVMELKEWYGSAALVGVNETHKSLMKTQITEN
jgi:uncharacterized protein YciI